MRAELATVNHCAVPFLSRAAVNLSLYHIISSVATGKLKLFLCHTYATHVSHICHSISEQSSSSYSRYMAIGQ